MQMLDNLDFLLEAGSRIPNRDMSPYDGKPFQCACGGEHLFRSRMDYRNFGSTGVNAKMMVTCPQDSSFTTLIETKYKFIVIFDRFISLAGSLTNGAHESTKTQKDLSPNERAQATARDHDRQLARLRIELDKIIKEEERMGRY